MAQGGTLPATPLERLISGLVQIPEILDHYWGQVNPMPTCRRISVRMSRRVERRP
jgi:hypothetical protein